MCPDLSYVERTYFARAAWLDKNNDFWIGSDVLCTNVGLIEAVYGEDSDALLTSANASSSEIDNELGLRFPKVFGLIKTYDKVAEKLSSKLESDWQSGVLVLSRVVYFTLVAKIDVNEVEGLGSSRLEDLIDVNLKGLKEAYVEIAAL